MRNKAIVNNFGLFGMNLRNKTLSSLHGTLLSCRLNVLHCRFEFTVCQFLFDRFFDKVPRGLMSAVSGGTSSSYQNRKTLNHALPPTMEIDDDFG